jgi:hypothetical protein
MQIIVKKTIIPPLKHLMTNELMKNTKIPPQLGLQFFQPNDKMII